MKIVTPAYYKDFKCIAGACTDTCCAGWDVDVDKESYKYYKKVKGAFGKRLKSVMVPSEDGGCTFTLNNGRCPFLNDENLCDLYTELGEDKLCETCDEFPRFINEYGAIREIGIAPSCKTAGELIFSYKDSLSFDEKEDDTLQVSCNDIDPYLYMQLRNARNIAYGMVSDRTYTINERCLLLMSFCMEIQKRMDADRDDLITNVLIKYSDPDERNKVIEKIGHLYGEDKDEKSAEQLLHFFDSFKGMEVINPDWNIYVEEIKHLFKDNSSSFIKQLFNEFDEYYNDRQTEYEQLLMYYVYRYFLDAVYDINIVLKAKNALIGYLALKTMDVADWYFNNKELSFERQVDLAHLYSRQFEHSYYNFEVYKEWFMSKRRYSCATLFKLLLMR